jgi:FKBP-type peptidyl-prolyl cis-trans isomerase FkpA
MKTKISICIFAVFCTVLNPVFSDDADAKAQSKNLDADTSYAFGVLMGMDLKQFYLNFDYTSFLNGFKDAMDGKEKIPEGEAMPIVENIISEAVEAIAVFNLAKGEKFLADNAKKKGVKTTKSGLQYEVIAEGKGVKPGPSSTVKVNYEGALIDGTVFDSSYKRGEPSEFPIDRVIPGWTEGIQLMKTGSHYKFFIPSKLAYGEREVGDGVIPANSVLIFDVELIEIVEE